ncbi:unnamed protein product [Coccothraustes coccothraustes]
MLLHVLSGSAAMRDSIPRVACAPPAGSGAPGEPGSGSRVGQARGEAGRGTTARSAPARRGASRGHPGGSGRALRGGGDSAQPGTAAPRGTIRVTPGAPLLRGLAGEGSTAGHEWAPEEPRRWRSTHRPGRAGARLPKEFFASLTGDAPCYNVYLYS